MRARCSCTGPSGPAGSCTSAAPGFDVRTRQNTPAPAASAPWMSGASASRPRSELAVKASAESPATGPNEPGVSPIRACAYAAAVTGTSPRFASASTRRPRSRAASIVASSAAHPGGPSRSKQASCGFTATQLSPAAAMRRGSGAPPRRPCAPARRPGGRRARRAVGPEPQRIRIEAEHELALALGHEGGEAVGEVGRGGHAGRAVGEVGRGGHAGRAVGDVGGGARRPRARPWPSRRRGLRARP